MTVVVATQTLDWLITTVHVADLGEPGAGIGLLVAQVLKAVILVGFLAGRRRGIGFAAPTFAIARAESRAMVPLVMPLFITETVGDRLLMSSGLLLTSRPW